MPPKIIRPYLWSNDLKKINLARDKNRIILNILNIGSRPATSWLFSFYSWKIIKKIFIDRAATGELSPKSLNYWALIFKVNKNELKRSRL